MTDILINIVETLILTCYGYAFCKDRLYFRNIVLFVLYFSLSFGFISVINQYSVYEGYLGIIDVVLLFGFVKLTSDLNAGESLITAYIPFIIIEVINSLLVCIMSLIIYRSIDFSLLISNYYIPVIILSKILFIIAICFVFRFFNQVRKHALEKSEYAMIFVILFLIDYIFVSFETMLYDGSVSSIRVLVSILCLWLLLLLVFIVIRNITKREQDLKKSEMENKILKYQINSIHQIEEAHKELHLLKHDINHFIQLASQQSEENGTDINAILKEMQDKFKEIIVPVHSGNPAVDYVLNKEKENAKKHGIDFVCTVNIVKQPLISDDELIILLTNAIDNAIQHIGIRKKVSVDIKNINDNIMFRIINSKDRPVLDKNRNFISYDEEHIGLGIESIFTILNRNDGTVYYEEDSENFTLSFMLDTVPNNSEKE